ncbi:MAG: hypothetical protein QNJ88_12965 [Acidimicrobiia bacterium]|nr:hypothetical protein [Acidimicrobiia bacterium]
MSREDPKPGRWILPLVVAGIIGFTYVFVNALPPAPVTETTTPPASDTTLPPAVSTTTTTTLPPAAAAFIAELDTLEAQANELLAEAQEINDDWDNENATFSGTESRFEDYEVRVAEYATAVAAVAPPPTVTSWTAASGSAGAMATAAVNMRVGFQDPDSAAGRRSGLADLQAAGSELLTAFAEARDAVGG